jgi:hypothetical protein
MSRTDSHKPHWVTVPWYYPTHHNSCTEARLPRWQHTAELVPCDLPADAVRHPGRRAGRQWWRELGPGETRCTWEPGWDGVRSWPHTPRWFVSHYWHNPERVRLRGELARARAEWNGSGGTDVDPEPRQARGSAEWAWS